MLFFLYLLSNNGFLLFHLNKYMYVSKFHKIVSEAAQPLGSQKRVCSVFLWSLHFLIYQRIVSTNPKIKIRSLHFVELTLNLHLLVIRFCGWLQFAELCPGHNFRGPICPCSRKKADVIITFVRCAFRLILGIVFFFLIILLR